MMHRKSPPSEHLEKIKSNKSLGFKEREIISFFDKISFCSIYTHILIDRTKIIKISLFFSIRWKFAIFTHHSNFKEK